MIRMMLSKRYIIETINDILKNTAQIVHSRHRSVSNFIMKPYFSIGSILFLWQQAKGIARILHRRHQTAVTILRAKQLLSTFCYYPLLMVWGGGVFTLHLYCIKHSVIPNWGISYRHSSYALASEAFRSLQSLLTTFCIHLWWWMDDLMPSLLYAWTLFGRDRLCLYSFAPQYT